MKLSEFNRTFREEVKTLYGSICPAHYRRLKEIDDLAQSYGFVWEYLNRVFVIDKGEFR